MVRSIERLTWVVPVVLALGVAACSQQQSQSTTAAAQSVEKSYTVVSSAPMKVDFLTGRLEGLTITERIDTKTKNVIDRPELRGTLMLTNDSRDQSARLIGGRLVFLDAKGQVIPVSKDRGDTSFTFSAYETQRLDPGKETSQVIDVPFPRAGLQAGEVHSIRLDLNYLPSAYRAQSVDFPVALKG